jgi:predicted dehydrogenase
MTPCIHKPEQRTSGSTRRQFLRQATVTAAAAAAPAVLAAPVYGQRQAPSPGRVIGANDRIIVAVIGLGGRGNLHAATHSAVRNVEVAYLCDPDSLRLAKAVQNLEAKQPNRRAEAVADFRRILEDKDVDAISIAAPNYLHAVATILGCQAGKHVYVEKPGSHNAGEAEAMVRAAETYRRVVQMGTQRRSFSNVIEGIRKLRDGAIGKVTFARAWYKNSRGGIGRGRPSPVPATLNWQIWQGPCPERGYKDNIHPYNWHWHWHYGGGELANNGVHTLDVVRWGLGVDHPKRVTFAGGRYHFDDDQETPDSGAAVFDFGHCGASWDVSSCNPRRAEKNPFSKAPAASAPLAFFGDRGSMLMSGANDYSIFDLEGNLLHRSEPASHNGGPHFQNFADAIREGTALNAPIQEGQKSTMLCHLGNIAYRLGRTLDIDQQTGRILNDTTAVKLWGREYRPGWQPTV